MGRVVGTMCGFKFLVFCKASGTRSSRDALVTYAAEWQWPRLGCACRREDAPTGAAPAAQDNEKPQTHDADRRIQNQNSADKPKIQPVAGRFRVSGSQDPPQ